MTTISNNNIYLEIDSTYRDRNSFPEISNFEIPISQSGQKTKENSVDPVCLSAPVAYWTGRRFNAFSTSIDTSIIVKIECVQGQSLIASTCDNISLIVKADIGGLVAPFVRVALQKEENYYLNAVARIQLEEGPPATYAFRRISYYEWLSTDYYYDYARIVLSSPFSDSVLPLKNGVEIQISDPTDLHINTPAIFVPNGYIGSNCYYGLYMYNETRKDSRRIINYDSYGNLALLDSPVANSWYETDSYSIRKELPLVPSIDFNNATLTTISCVTELFSLSTETNYYNHNFIRIIPANNFVGRPNPPTGEMRRIIGYSVDYNIIPGFGVSTFTFTPPLSALPTANMFEILSWSYDNASPLIYSEALLSQQGMICIELLNIILPNKTLNNQFGNKIVNYPYVYIELSNVSSTSSGSGAPNIYSNNPNSSRMLFRACINDNNQSLDSEFVKLDGDRMVQTIKFQPNTNLIFRVILPNGEFFRVNDPEYFSPRQPNDKNQITALFAIKKLNSR